MENHSIKGVQKAIKQFLEAVDMHDIVELEKVVAPEPQIVFYGSQAGDKQIGWAAIKTSFKEQFAETSKIKSEVLDSHISVVGKLAWAAYDLRYTEEGSAGAGSFESRWTCVLQQYRDGWKFVHMHHSIGR